MALKTFTDSAGERWRVWNVDRVPLVGRTDYLEPEYQSGWLVFERIGSDERRRLGGAPPDWDALAAEELARLCTRAKPVLRLGARDGAGSEAETRQDARTRPG